MMMNKLMEGTGVKQYEIPDKSPGSPSRSTSTASPSPSPTSPPRTPRPLPSASFVTETVFGFLDFVTTVGDTVMVFTPANAEAEQSSLEQQRRTKTPPSLTLTSTPSLGLESLFDSLERRPLVSSSILSTGSPFVPTIQPSTVEEAKELVSVIRSDFYGPEEGREGLVAATQRTLVNEGATTIFTTEVEGTHLAGEYVQLVRSGSEVLGPATTPGPGFPGSAHLTSLPTIALEASLETEQKPKRFDSSDNRRANKARESLEEVRKSANLSFKERLKQRFQKFREEHGSVLDRTPTSNSRSSGGFGRAIGQHRDREGQSENTVSFGKKSDIIRNKLHQVLNQPAKVTSTAILTRTFVPAHLRTTVSPTTRKSLIDPSTSRHFLSILREAPTRGPLLFPSSSDRFKPPEIRKNLLNRVLGKLDKEEEEAKEDTKQKNEDVESEDEKDDNTTVLTATEEEDLPIIQSGIDDVDEADEGVTIPSEPLVLLENINLEPMPLVQSTTHHHLNAPPQSTLHVATVPLPNTPESYLEVITVRSPYSFEVDEQDEQSTRFITVTQTLTSAIEPTPVLDNTPLFDFDGDVPNPSPVLLEDIYDGTSLRQIPTNFIDFDLELEQEESINQETILPAEVPSLNALKSDDVEKKEVFTQTPVIEPSFTSTPNPATELGLAPAQLQYLQLIGAQLTDLQPKVVTLTAPVVTTEEAYETQTLTVGLAGKELVTTLVTPIGLTTRTAFTYLTTTINPAIGPLIPSTTLVSSPVIQNTVLTETETQHYRILFRNRPITTTLTSTRLVTTQMTSFVTETVTLQPPSPLLAGILG